MSHNVFSFYKLVTHNSNLVWVNKKYIGIKGLLNDDQVSHYHITLWENVNKF